MCGLRTRPRTDVDPPRVELTSAGGAYRLAASGRQLVYSMSMIVINRQTDTLCRRFCDNCEGRVKAAVQAPTISATRQT